MENLPLEILSQIFLELCYSNGIRKSVSNFSVVCKFFRQASHSELIWKLLCIRYEELKQPLQILQTPITELPQVAPKSHWFVSFKTIELERQRVQKLLKSTTSLVTAERGHAGSLKRIMKEYKDWERDPPPNSSVAMRIDENGNPDPFVWHGIFIGPQGTPYADGFFQFTVRFRDDYPFKPPKVLILTKLYHCNFSDNGDNCFDILYNQWSPALTIMRVCLSMMSCFSDPNPDDPLRSEIARQFKTDRKEHDRVARMWTEAYARL